MHAGSQGRTPHLQPKRHFGTQWSLFLVRAAAGGVLLTGYCCCFLSPRVSPHLGQPHRSQIERGRQRGCCRQWGTWARAARGAKRAPTGAFPSAGEACRAKHGADTAPLSAKVGGGCRGCLPRVSTFLLPSCSECGGGGSPSRFSFNRRGKFLLGSEHVVLTQRETGWEYRQAPQSRQRRGTHLHQGQTPRPQGFSPHQVGPCTPRGSSHTEPDPGTPGVPSTLGQTSCTQGFPPRQGIPRPPAAPCR